MKKMIVLASMIVTYALGTVDGCASAIKEFEVVMKLNEFYGKQYGMAKKKYARFGVDSAKKVIHECQWASTHKRMAADEEANYYITYYSEGLALADSGRTYPYGFVQDTCWNTQKAAEIIDADIYFTYTHPGDVLLYRTTTDLLRNTAVRAASICEDMRQYELMGKAQEIYNKYTTNQDATYVYDMKQ